LSMECMQKAARHLSGFRRHKKRGNSAARVQYLRVLTLYGILLICWHAYIAVD
jgi:hypothetical protein